MSMFRQLMMAQHGIPRNGLLMYAPLDRKASTTPTGQSITCLDAVTDSSFKVIDGIPCYDKTGIPMYGISIGINQTMSSYLTLSLWLKYGSGSPQQSFILGLTNGTFDFSLFIDGLDVNVWTDNQSKHFYRIPDFSVMQTWNNLVYKLSGTSASFFLNGVQTGSTITSRLPITNILTFDAPNITNGLTSYLSTVRIYDRALSDSEIRRLAAELHPLS